MSEYDPNYIPVKNYVLVGLKAVVTNRDKVTLSWEHNDHKWVTTEEAMEEPGLPQEHKDFISKALS